MTGGDDAARPGGDQPGEDENAFDQDAFDQAFAAEFGQTLPAEKGAPAEQDAPAEPKPASERSIIAVVLTPIRSAQALAALCRMQQIDADVIGSKNGALAVRTITGEVDEAELLLTGAPAQAVDLATTLSRTVKAGMLLLTAQLGTGEEGVTGAITAREYNAGNPGKDVPAGLVLASADEVLESLLLGTVKPEQAPGRIDPATMAPAKPGSRFSFRRKRS